ncbi:MAG TPA: penicillin-binding transpeptidase domain-containing protein [bacterium]|nr:penicillin-binding transpeptidase domain-containing protein [bacterium]
MAMKRTLLAALLLLAVVAATARALTVLPVHRWFIYDVNGKLSEQGGAFDEREAAALAVFGPGSTLKPFVLAAAVAGGLDPQTKYTCKPFPLTVPAQERCWLADGHGPVELAPALANSCSAYTRWATKYVDADRYRKLLVDLGFGERLPAKDVFRALGGEAWMGAAKGIAVTADELARAYLNAFAEPPKIRLAGRAALRQGLIECCLTGTGKTARRSSPMLSIMGKTGTGHTLDGRQLGVFVGLTPADKPTQAIVMLVRDHDGMMAAQMAGDRLSWWLNQPGR